MASSDYFLTSHFRFRGFLLPVHNVLNQTEGEKPRVLFPQVWVAQKCSFVRQEAQEPASALLHQVSPFADRLGLAGRTMAELNHLWAVGLGHEKVGQIAILAQMTASKIPEVGYSTLGKVLVRGF